MQKAIITTIALFALVGCGEQTPLEKLRQDIIHEEFNTAFWSKEREAKTPLWQAGLEYCKAHEEKLNCGDLMMVYRLSNGSTKLPGYGNSGESLKMPNF